MYGGFFCTDCLESVRQARCTALMNGLPVKYRRLDEYHGIKKQADLLAGKSLYLYGPPGVGKTVLSIAILKRIWQSDGRGRFVVWPEFIMSLQADYASSFEDAKHLAQYEGCLALDDFAAEKPTDFVRQVSYYLINHREGNLLQTVITTNHSLDHIAAVYDDRTASRLAGMCRVIRMEGKDLRVGEKCGG